MFQPTKQKSICLEKKYDFYQNTEMNFDENDLYNHNTRPPSIVYQDEHLLVLYKPPRYYVHPPENKYARQKVGRNTCLHWLSDHHNLTASPIHRLDYPTEGLVIFGLQLHATQVLNQMMREKQIYKQYDAIVRGWLEDDYGSIDLPLELDSTGELAPCQTLYSTVQRIELPYSVHSQFQTTRYSWLTLELKTGRWHQIRRHMNRVSHPVIGDREHGDSHHNRFFRDQLGINGLCLRAKRLKFTHPIENKVIDLTTPTTQSQNKYLNTDIDKWNKLELIFQSPKV
jgi:tRNA pseudouridine65 synthase